MIGRRIRRLGDETSQVLGVAAVIGRDFDAELLGRVVEQDDDRLLDVLEGAVEASVLTESNETPGRFTFAHALINHTLYDELGTTRRARLHRRIAEALEEVCGEDPGPQARRDREPLVGRHRRGGSRQGARVHAPGRRARRRAARARRGARWFASALELHAGHPDATQEERCDLLISLGEAQRQSGDPDFRETLLDASAVAQELDDGPRLVRAALANTRGFFSAAGIVDTERVAVLEAAVEAVPDDDPSSRARLLVLLANELVYAGDLDRRLALTDEALKLARDAGDDVALAYVGQFVYLAIGHPETLDHRLETLTEAEAAAERTGDPVLRLWVASVLGLCLTEAGRVEEAGRSFDELHTIAEAVGEPTMRWVDIFERSLWTYLAGDIAGADELAERAVELGTNSGEPDALAIYVGQLVNLRYEQGRLEEVEDLIVQATEETPGLTTFKALLGLTHLELGREDEARALVEAAAADGFADVSRDFLWLSTMCVYGEVAARLEMTDAASDLYDRLLPWEHQIGLTGCSTWGGVARYLGMLAAALGRHDDAEAHYRRSAEIHEQIGAAVFLARTRLGWAELLLARGGDGDREQAQALLGQALATARELGSPALEASADALLRTSSAAGAQ